MEKNLNHVYNIQYGKVSEKNKIILLILLILLNFVIRIPSIPHEKGGDSFYIHSLANSVTTYGYADWWWNWLSIFGFYPYSYASAIPFSVSGMSQLIGLTGIDMEKTILLYSVMLGLLSIFTVYILAGIIYEDFLFKYLMALFFSVSQGIQIYSTWEISTRGPFIIFLPLFLFILLKNMNYMKAIFFLLIIGMFLAATHHYYFFLIPLTVLYFTIKVLFKIKFLNFTGKISLSNLYLMGLLAIFMLPFFLRKLIESGSRYSWIIEMFISNARYLGPIIIFLFGGLIYNILKRNKKFEEWYFLGALLLILPFSYNLTYGAFILILFLVFFISIAFRNLLIVASARPNKFLNLFIICNILFFVAFSGFYNHERTGRSKSDWYLSENPYQVAVWGMKYIPDNSVAVGEGLDASRIMAISDEHPSGPKINISQVQLNKVSPFSLDFYFEGPYIEKSGTSLEGLISWLIEMDDVDNAKGIIRGLNIKYFIDDKLFYSEIGHSIQMKRDIIYTNGRINIWLL
ncbi:MAG: hypothetical protein OIN87_06960 [Candidatus Methanoperedens sp.]|nr:hypothetical protein [Candidatus Methanoperedens sp.]